MKVVDIILSQLGGNKFLAMTGAKYLLDLGDGLRFNIPKNGSKANKVEITLNGNDLYDVKFYKYTPYKFRITKDGQFKETKEKCEVIKEFNDIWCDMLVEVFEQTTKMYTRLF